MRHIQQYQLSAWQPYIFFENEFTADECDSIMHLAKIVPPVDAKTGSDDNQNSDKTIRSSKLHWLDENSQSKWIYDRLEGVCQKACPHWYPFKLSGFPEQIQITKYFASEGGHYDWHQDFGPGNMSTRKLSLVMLLNDPSEFKGGELEIMSINDKNKAVKHLSRGTVIAFPSWEFHRVLKITEGERWSLVSWVHGPLFS